MITNSTIVNNTANSGGGGIRSSNSFGDTPTSLRNTIVANNSSPDILNPIVSLGFNLIGVDPLLGPLAFNGGATRTHALRPGSPAIDTGDPTTFPPTDQRGVTRPQDGDGNGNARADIGAYERRLTDFVQSAFADFDGDGRSDYSTFRPSNNTWFIRRSSNNSFFGIPFGFVDDFKTPGDYDGDGRADISVFRPSNGTFFVLRSSDGTVQSIQFGQNGDEPVARDYNGDGRTDYAVVRRVNGQLIWFILTSNNFTFTATQFGLATDVVAPGDYDGDGRFDLAVYRGGGADRTRQATFFVQRSRDGFLAVQFGLGSDLVVPGDYDGDGRTDFAVVRAGVNYTWFILTSSNFSFRAVQLGTKPFFTTQADYDGDGRTDISVWDPVNGRFSTLRSTDGVIVQVNFGQNGDFPIANYDTH